MLNLPRTRKQWMIATISALAGFFGGGVIVAYVQKTMKKVM